MTKHRARRRRLGHPGVKVLVLADGRPVARWTDPLSGRAVQQSLTKLGLHNAEDRLRWAIQKSEALASLRAEIAAGGTVAERVTLPEAVSAFLAGCQAEATRDIYSLLVGRFASWAQDHGIRCFQDVSSPLLARYHDHVRQGTTRTPVRGGRRGEKQSTRRRLSPESINKHYLVLKTFLNWARRRGWTPHLSTDSIRDALRPVKVPREAIDFLRPESVRTLLEAALRHDADTFSMTREEHVGLRPVGTTPKNQPIAPFLLFRPL